MTRVNAPLFAFNRGLISRLALARVDQERLRLSAEEQTNWMPRIFGSMMLRPGLEHLGATRGHRPAVSIPFVFEVDDQARLELTPGAMRVWINDFRISRPSVSARLLNGDFSPALGNAHWTDADEAGAASGATTGLGALELLGSGSSAAARWQQVAVPAAERSLEHAVRVVVRRGPVTLRIGATAGSDDMLGATTLATGTHSLAFRPGKSSFFVHVSNRADTTSLLDRIQVESGGPMEVDTPYLDADLAKVRWSQSRDVIFLACDGYQQRRIERRAARSWSVVLYEAADGPFRDENLSRVTIAPSGLKGDVTLTASADVFRAGHVGALFRLTSSGQKAAEAITAEDVFTADIRVTGVGDDRIFRAAKSGAGTATVTLQRSIGEPGAWEDVQTIAAGGHDIDDDLDNQIIHYRIGVKTGDHSSGTVNVSLTFARGAVDGVARITKVTSPTSAEAATQAPFGGTAATAIWAEGEWSDHRGWPTAVCLFQGRLWWGGRGRLWGSASDAFASFDANIEGDSGPIAKTISDGPADVVTWIAAAKRLMLGAVGGVFEARSSSLDEPLTPTASALRRFSTMGAANVAAAPVNERVLFVQRAGLELLEAADMDALGTLEATRLSAIVPEIAGGGFVRVAVQHQPDVRLHCVRADGKAAVLLTDPVEEVRCWVLVETAGVIEDVCVLPSGEEDAVYYTVKRTIGGAVRRYTERWALERQCRGGAFNRQADSFKVYSGPPTNTIDGLGYLDGEEVVIWADGTVRASRTVSGGEVAVSGDACTSAVVGLPYTARFRSTKLAYAAQKGTALTQPKRINRIGFILADTHASGLRFGRDFDNLDPLPERAGYAAADPDAVHRDLDLDGAPFPGTWDADARLCLAATAPKPCTILAVALDMETVDR